MIDEIYQDLHICDRGTAFVAQFVFSDTRRMTTGTRTEPTSTRAAVTRERVLDAAETCFGGGGLDHVTLDAIALAAGVHRATLHRNFPGGRDELVVGVLAREAGRLMDRVLAVIDEATDAESAVLDAATAIVLEVRARPGLQPLLAASATRAAVFGPAAAELRSAAANVWDHVASLAAQEGTPVVHASSARVVDHLFRVGISLVADPGDLTDAEAVRAHLHTFVVPALLPGSRPQMGGV